MAKLELVEPTKERLEKAEGCWYARRNAAGRIEGATVVFDAPVERLRAEYKRAEGRRRDPERVGLSQEEYNAAVKFRHHWHKIGGVGVKAMDPTQERIIAAAFGSDPNADTDFHRRQYWGACEKVGLLGERVIVSVVCNEESLVTAGSRLGYACDKQARAGAFMLLKNSLNILSRAWGL